MTDGIFEMRQLVATRGLFELLEAIPAKKLIDWASVSHAVGIWGDVTEAGCYLAYRRSPSKIANASYPSTTQETARRCTSSPRRIGVPRPFSYQEIPRQLSTRFLRLQGIQDGLFQHVPDQRLSPWAKLACNTRRIGTAG